MINHSTKIMGSFYSIRKKRIIPFIMLLNAGLLISGRAYGRTPLETLVYDGQVAAIWCVVAGLAITTLLYAFNSLLSSFKPSKTDGLLDVLFNDFWLSRFITVKINRILLFLSWWAFYSFVLYTGWCWVQNIVPWVYCLLMLVCAVFVMIAIRLSLEVAVAIIKIAENTDVRNKIAENCEED